MVLVGDSVHAPSPSTGQDASPAIESAIELARCLRDLPYDQAFQAYAALRHPRGLRIIKETTRKSSDKAAGAIARTINGRPRRNATALLIPYLGAADAWSAVGGGVGA